MTFGEKFIKENVIFENGKDGRPRRAYILCRNHLAAQSNYIEKHLLPGIVRKYKADPEHGIISFEVHIRFARAMEKTGDNIPRLFILLNQVFTVETIRLFWRDVWLAHHNVQVRKQNTAEQQRLNRERKLHAAEMNDPVHRDVLDLTKNRSVRSASIRIRNFQR